MEKTIHHGRNIKRFREVFGMKQEGLAYELGEDWDQRKVSALEQKEVVDPKVLELVAQALKVPVEAIKNFDEEQAVHIIANTVNNSDHATGNSLYSYCPTFNPLDELLKSLEENKKLYERLLQAEKEKTDILQKVLDKLK